MMGSSEPLWYGLAIVLAAVAMWLLCWSLFRDRSRGRRRCPGCWYSMEGVPGTGCPECGRDAKREKGLLKTRRRWSGAVVGVLVAVAAYIAANVPRMWDCGWVTLMPSTVLVELAPVRSLAMRLSRAIPGMGASVPVDPWQAEVVSRAMEGRLWRWQSQRYFGRFHRALQTRFDVTTPARWLRSKPLPMWGAQGTPDGTQAKWGSGEWEDVNLAALEPPLSPSMRLPLRHILNTHPVYETETTVHVQLVDSAAEVFGVLPSDKGDAFIRRLANLSLTEYRGEWNVRAVSSQNNDPERVFVGFRVDIVIDGRTVGSTTGYIKSTDRREGFESWEPVRWLGNDPPKEDLGRATLVMRSDIDLTWKHWSKSLGQDSDWLYGVPTTWVGTLEWPAFAEGEAP